MKKVYLLDTNVLLSDTEAIFSFQDNDLILPLVVLEELDKQKSRQDEIGKNARKVNRALDELRKLGNLNQGLQLPTGGTLRVCAVSESGLKSIPPEMQNNISKVDNLIIALALELSKQHENFVLVSRDINVRVKCDALGVRSEDYLRIRIKQEKDELYRGVERLQASQTFINEFYRGTSMVLEPEMYADKKLYSNQFLVMKEQAGASASAIARFEAYDKPLKQLADIKDAFGLIPRNKEQKFALDLLYDPNVKLVSLIGPSGTGKTLLAAAAGVDLTRGGQRKYDKLIITRPVQPLGKDIGFLPGTLHEKMEPWIAPLKDNLNFLFGSKGKGNKTNKRTKDNEYLSLEIERGHIEIEAITFIRGRSIPNSYIIIDEAQNLSVHELKTIVTRVGEGTKIVLTGDIEQIDNVHVDACSNGLTYAVERFKEYAIAGHVTLLKGERSELATLASKIL